MKRSVSFLMALIITAASLCLGSFAAKDQIEQNPPLKIELSTPVVDGIITDSEGWSEPVYMNDKTLNYRYKDKELTMWSEVYFAADRAGFYFAANIYDGVSAYDPDGGYTDTMSNEFVPVIDSGNGSFMGDEFILNLDPLAAVTGLGYMGGVDTVLSYTVRMFNDSQVLVTAYGLGAEEQRSSAAQGKITEQGWNFEVFIAWGEILNDFNHLVLGYSEYTNGDISLDIDDILTNNALIKASCIYEDWYYPDPENYPEYYNTYTTAPQVCIDGHLGSDKIREWGIDSLGIDITLLIPCGKGGHRWTNWIRITEPTYFEKGRDISLCNSCGEIMYRDVEPLEYENEFNDVKWGSWYYEGVKYCVMKGYMNGMSKYSFAPNQMLTREQCVVVIANMLGVDTKSYKYIDSGFDDVPTGRWYSGAITWAKKAGIISGIGENKFGTGQNIQRAAFARIIYGIADHMGMPTDGRADLSVYEDYEKLPSWAIEEISWAVANNIVLSIKNDALVISPYTSVKRAQCATMLWQMGLIYDELTK